MHLLVFLCVTVNCSWPAGYPYMWVDYGCQYHKLDCWPLCLYCGRFRWFFFYSNPEQNFRLSVFIAIGWKIKKKNFVACLQLYARGCWFSLRLVPPRLVLPFYGWIKKWYSLMRVPLWYTKMYALIRLLLWYDLKQFLYVHHPFPLILQIPYR